MDIRHITVIGAGQMGHGIALVAALNKYDVVLYAPEKSESDTAQTNISKAFKRLEKKQRNNNLSYDDVNKYITHSQNLNDAKNSDIIIEAVVENEHIKRDVFSKLCDIISDHTIIASNTSSISITRLAASTNRPDRFCGMHFMNPVPVMPLIEVIRGLQTSPETFETVKNLSSSLGKEIAVAEDFPGFIVNRILLPMINEAIYALYEGVGSVTAIDKAMKLGTNHPLGPLELADYIGLDTCLAILNTLHNDLADTKYRPCPLLMKYVEAGWLGVKTKRGFYDYGQDTPTPTR